MLVGHDDAGFIICRLEGDETLNDVLRIFDISIAELLEYNEGCDLFELHKGQKLYIRDVKKSGGYTLKENETLRTVAKKFKVSIISLLKANPNFLPNEIRQGMRIDLPDQPYQNSYSEP